MDPELETQIKERFAQLPPDLQQAIQSSDMDEQLRSIGQAHGLHIDQMGTLGDEVRLVMLGFAEPDDFAEALAEQAHIPTKVAETIASEVGEHIFLPIRESMKAFSEAPAALEDAPGDSGEPQSQAVPGQQPQAAPEKPAEYPMPEAQTMLTQPTVTPAGLGGPTPRPYKTDPYREPAE